MAPFWPKTHVKSTGGFRMGSEMKNLNQNRCPKGVVEGLFPKIAPGKNVVGDRLLLCFAVCGLSADFFLSLIAFIFCFLSARWTIQASIFFPSAPEKFLAT